MLFDIYRTTWERLSRNVEIEPANRDGNPSVGVEIDPELMVDGEGWFQVCLAGINVQWYNCGEEIIRDFIVKMRNSCETAIRDLDAMIEDQIMADDQDLHPMNEEFRKPEQPMRWSEEHQRFVPDDL